MWGSGSRALLQVLTVPAKMPPSSPADHAANQNILGRTSLTSLESIHLRALTLSPGPGTSRFVHHPPPSNYPCKHAEGNKGGKMTLFEHLLCAKHSGTMPLFSKQACGQRILLLGCREECESIRDEPAQVLASHKTGKTLVPSSGSLYTSCCL